MIKKIVISTVLIANLFAIDKTSVVNELNCKTYSFNEDMAGIYKYFNTTAKDWFLYMPSLDYLLVHETGKSKVADGAEVIATSDFDSLTSNANAKFGSYIGSNDRVTSLSNQTFNINDDMAGIYKYFDPTNKLWFLYMPKLNYLLVHETGKTLVSDGALVIKVSEEFQEISVSTDPFGNTTGSIMFVAKSGCSSSSTPASSSSSTSASSSSSTSASSSSSTSASSSSSTGTVDTPPSVPTLGSSSSSATTSSSSSSTGLSTPPQTPSL